MAATFISLCNQVLRRLNEVEIDPLEFNETRGVQSLVKDSVKTAIATINRAEYEWPFNAGQHTLSLVPGQTEYAWPEGISLKVADWNSFQIQADESLNSSYQVLSYLERDEWYKNQRDNDYQAGNAGRDCPQFVFPSHGYGFGVTPSPDKAYSLSFRYYSYNVNLVNAEDTSRIPEAFSQVIVDGAMYHLYMFKDNPESAQLAWAAFEKGLHDLQTLYINNYHYIYDTRLPQRAVIGTRTMNPMWG